MKAITSYHEALLYPGSAEEMASCFKNLSAAHWKQAEDLILDASLHKDNVVHLIEQVILESLKAITLGKRAKCKDWLFATKEALQMRLVQADQYALKWQPRQRKLLLERMCKAFQDTSQLTKEAPGGREAAQAHLFLARFLYFEAIGARVPQHGSAWLRALHAMSKSVDL